MSFTLLLKDSVFLASFALPVLASVADVFLHRDHFRDGQRRDHVHEPVNGIEELVEWIVDNDVRWLIGHVQGICDKHKNESQELRQLEIELLLPLIALMEHVDGLKKFYDSTYVLGSYRAGDVSSIHKDIHRHCRLLRSRLSMITSFTK